MRGEGNIRKDCNLR